MGTSGVKRIIRPPTEADNIDPEEKHLERNIDHLKADMIRDHLYQSRLNDDQKKELHKLFQSFIGTKNYHNYTKDIKPTEMCANRNMTLLTADEFHYVNTDTLKVTDCNDKNALEFVHFYLEG